MAEYTWAELNVKLEDMTEQQAWDALKAEKEGKNRMSHLLRIYGRANLLRSQRERRALVGEEPKAKKGNKRATH